MKNKNIENVEVIYMNKESIFEAPFIEYEMVAVTDNFDEWKKHIKLENEYVVRYGVLGEIN